MRSRARHLLFWLATVIMASTAALVMLVGSAPGYLFERGFPLDDAWIHAVYARSFASSLSFAYNPGVPAAGETAPLWAVVSSIPHALASDPVVATKILGFTLHCLAAALVPFAFEDRPSLPSFASAMLVSVHPDLVAGAVSGMETSLATVVAFGLAIVVRRRVLAAIAAISALAYLARPELVAVALVLPVGWSFVSERRVAFRTALAAGAGACIAVVGWALRTWAVTGKPLPSTFYAKAGIGPWGPFEAQLHGFRDMLGALALVRAPGLVLVIVIVLGVCAIRLRRHEMVSACAVALASLVFLAVSFALVQPVDAQAFYHQRYVLPGVALAVAALPWAIVAIVSLFPKPAQTAAFTLFVLAAFAELLGRSRSRHLKLENDARNIDDVQVAIGKVLASADPNANVWTTDAGAVRYFGAARVIDTIGLNTPEILSDRAQAFLDAHPASMLVLMPSWVGLDRPLPARPFKTSTPYTVTSSPWMGTQWLGLCPPGEARRYAVRGRVFELRCAS